MVHADDLAIDLPNSAKDDKVGLLVFRANNLDVTQIAEMAVISFVTNLSQLPNGLPSATAIEIAQLPPTDVLLDRLEMLELLTPVLVYVPDLSIDEIKTALEKIYQQSDDLRFEYNNRSTLCRSLLLGWLYLSGLVTWARSATVATSPITDSSPNRSIWAFFSLSNLPN